MSVWRYKAIAASGAGGSTIHSGEVSGHSGAEVRASLRRVGLQVIDLHPIRHTPRLSLPAIAPLLRGHLRRRRTPVKGELFDSLATMLDSGLPLLEAVDIVARSAAAAGRTGSIRSMLLEVRDRLRSGESLALAMRGQPSWFTSSEIAMVEAGQHRGELPGVLRRLAERHERSGELGSRLVAVLTYPLLVAIVGVGVVVFLSTKTLPDLVGILTESNIPPPRLTTWVMWTGQSLLHWWPALLLLSILSAGIVGAISAAILKREVSLPYRLRRIVPSVIRRMALSRLCLELAELMRSGVPLVEALRILAPTLAFPACGTLARRVLSAADRVERGESIDAALDDPLWFDAEFTRLLATGQASGELDTLLSRLGERELRRSRRLIDRLASLLEPAVILLLAGFVGLVAMAAVLPLIRLQEAL